MSFLCVPFPEHLRFLSPYSGNGALFISLPKAHQWTPLDELWLFGKPTNMSCNSQSYFGLVSLFTKLKLPSKLVAGVFGSVCSGIAYLLILSL